MIVLAFIVGLIAAIITLLIFYIFERQIVFMSAVGICVIVCYAIGDLIIELIKGIHAS